jgi:glyoxylase-like metal-dependent hydrolase (beta-lactamase superfamily II)
MIEKIIVGGIATNCYIISLADGSGAIVVDPGDDAPAIVKKLESLSLVPRYFLFTHGHFDHLAALPALVSYYANKNIHPEIAIHKNDALFLGEGAYEQHCASFRAVTGGDTSFVDALWDDMPAATKILEEGDVVEQFTTIHLPGHSSGSVGFYDEKNGILVSGDTLFNGGVGRTDLPESNPRDLEKSLVRIFELPPETKVYPGHGPETTAGQEAKYYL